MMKNDLESLVKAFVDSINNENSVLESLALVSQDKQQLIIKGNVKELDSLINKEGIIISHLEELEDARFELQEKLQETWGISSEAPVAREILSQASREVSTMHQELEMAISKLDYNLTRLKALNNHNYELIEQSLDYIANIQSTLTGPPSTTYSPTGTQQPDPPTGVNLLDKKV